MPDETMDDVLELMRVDCDGERSISWYREHIESALTRRDAALLEVAKEIEETWRQHAIMDGFGLTITEAKQMAARIREIVAGKKESGG